MCPARSASQVPRAPLHPIVTHAAYLESAAILGQHWVAAGVAVRARRALRAGDELTTTYIDTSLPVAERKSRLLHGYGFTCSCERCSAEEGPAPAAPA